MSEITVFDAPKNPEEVDQLRPYGPIVRVRTQTGHESWMVLSHERSKQLLGDHRLGRAPLVSGDVPFRAAFPDFLKRSLLFTDDPEHARLRKSVAKWFTARRIEQMRERTIATANRLLDEIERKGQPADLVEDFAAPLPIDVLLNLLGADLSMSDTFLEWTRVLQGTGDLDPAYVATTEQACADYLTGEILRKRTEPGEDLLSALAAIPEGADSLTDDEILRIAMLILIAGFDNTANTIGSGIYALLGHPAQRAEYLADIPGRTALLAEEMLRHGRQSMGSGLAIAGVPFVALEDFETDGILIRAGDAVIVNRNAANHDAAVFENPHELDVARTPNPHFGLSHGIHHCLGAPLARMELQVAFSTVFTRFPDLELAGTPAYVTDTISQPIVTLPVRWGSAAAS